MPQTLNPESPAVATAAAIKLKIPTRAILFVADDGKSLLFRGTTKDPLYSEDGTTFRPLYLTLFCGHPTDCSVYAEDVLDGSKELSAYRLGDVVIFQGTKIGATISPQDNVSDASSPVVAIDGFDVELEPDLIELAGLTVDDVMNHKSANVTLIKHGQRAILTVGGVEMRLAPCPREVSCTPLPDSFELSCGESVHNYNL